MVSMALALAAGVAAGQMNVSTPPARPATGVPTWAATAPVGANMPAINPPPISIRVENGTVVGVVAALNGQMPEKKFVPYYVSGNGPTYTLDVKDQPFWEIMAQLASQHRLSISDGSQIPQTDAGPQVSLPGGLGLTSSDAARGSGTIKRPVIRGGFMVVPVKLTSTLSQQPGKAAVASLDFQYQIMADPRIAVARVGEAIVVEARDDAGNVWPAEPRALSANETTQRQRLLHVWDGTIRLTPPEVAGKRLTLSIQAPFAIELTGASKTVEDVEHHVGETISVGAQTVVLRNFTVDSTNVSAEFESSSNEEIPPVRLRVLDADGTVVAAAPNFRALRRTLKSPFKVEMAAVATYQNVRVPFEFRELLLP